MRLVTFTAIDDAYAVRRSFVNDMADKEMARRELSQGTVVDREPIVQRVLIAQAEV